MKTQRGFTLLELLIVVALVVLVGGLMGGRVGFVLSLFLLSGLVLFALLTATFWEGKSGLSPRRRNILMLVLYLLLVADIAVGYRYWWRNWGKEGIRMEVAMIRSEMRTLSIGLETYYIDNKTYPPAEGPDGTLVPFAPDGSTVAAGYVPRLLTTPVAYLRSLPLDRFSGGKAGGPLRYATNGASCWILASPGPDRDDDVAIEEYPDSDKGNCDRTKFFSHLGPGAAVEYDPTNGARSSGDIVRVGPQ